VLALVQIPEHGDTILATRSSKRTIGGDRNGVDVTGVAVVVGLQLELRELPDLIKCISECWQKFKLTGKEASEILVENVVSLSVCSLK